MESLNLNPNPSRHYFWLAIIILALSEVMLVSFFADARGIAATGLFSHVLSYAGDALKWAITSSAVFALFIAKNPRHVDSILANQVNHSRLYWSVPLHIIVFAVFLIFTIDIFGGSFTPANSHLTLWVSLLLLVAITFFNLLSPVKNLIEFINEYKGSIVISLFAGFAVLVISLSSRLLWEPLSAFTMHGSYFLLGFVYDGLVIETSEKLIGVNDFIVHIAPVCSGIDGMALSFGITSTYLYFSRNTLRFPHAFLLLPIAVVLSLLFNVLRVAALIAIGTSISEEIAIEGFHSVAGWISSVLIALLIIFGFSSWSQFQRKDSKPSESDNRAIEEANLATAILIPFVLFMAAALIAGIFKSDFDYLYPVKLLLPFAALFFYFRRYELKIPSNKLEPVAIGLLVALLWVIIVPADIEANETFSEHLFEMPIWAISLWLTARILGFWIFAPIVEELVFRCYLLNRLGGVDLRTDGKIAFSVIAFFVSSILFGLLHADWIAGTIAGALFAVARYRSNSMTSPIIAHASANIFVGIWAIAMQNWVLL